MNFEHDYYLLDEKMKETVLCMKCAVPVKKPGFSKEDVRKSYNEIGVEWSYGNGIKANGVIITCPSCKELTISDEDKPKIKKQVIQAVELQMVKTNTKQEEINRLKNLFSQMELVGRI